LHDAERAEINARISLVDERASVTLGYVALTKALGLGWGE
jgi:outer membrane protein TolC